VKSSRQEHSGYKPNGDTPLSPKEIMLIRDFLVSSNEPFDFMLYVLILLSILLFLREEEAVDVKGISIDKFEFSTSIVSDGGIVDSLSVWIKGIFNFMKGKSDQQPILMSLWADSTNSEFCPIQNLLIWIYYSGMKGGMLFPSKSEVDNPPSDGFYKTNKASFSGTFQKYLS
jgi:hypothetical protein